MYRTGVIAFNATTTKRTTGFLPFDQFRFKGVVIKLLTTITRLHIVTL